MYLIKYCVVLGEWEGHPLRESYSRNVSRYVHLTALTQIFSIVGVVQHNHGKRGLNPCRSLIQSPAQWRWWLFNGSEGCLSISY